MYVVESESVNQRTEDYRQPLVVCNCLVLRNVDFSGFLVQALVIPVRVKAGQLARQAVVLPELQDLEHRQLGILVHSYITCIRHKARSLSLGCHPLSQARLTRES